MTGHPGLFDGCQMKECTAASLRMCDYMIQVNGFVHAYTHIYIDGSYQEVHEEPVMSWALLCQGVEARLDGRCV